jgi:hypothetical protein
VESPRSESGSGALPEFYRFLRDYPLRILIASTLVLIPCFWHREIVSSDLGSHLYNAWLAQLIRHGQAPGLWLSSQHTNVLFDYLLSGFGAAFGLHAAEKIAVSISVLIFFWGVFALVSAATRRAPWYLSPCIALFTYGWTFHLGFFNYYLSLGLGFFGLAILWRGLRKEWILAAALAALSVVAHPLGLVWLMAAGAYVVTAEHLSHRGYRLALFAVAIGALVGFHSYLWRHYNVYGGTAPAYAYNGADQLLLFGPRYQIPEYALLTFAVIALARDILRRHRERGFWEYYALPIQLYVLVELSVWLLPGGIHFPPPTAALALLTERLTSVSAALICCLLGAIEPRRWHLYAGAAIALVFFTFVYQDTASVNRMERQVVELVSQLPPNQRVMATIEKPQDSRVLIQHIVDRACIMRCFSYGNYEPSTGLFRVRATPGNPYVASSYNDAVDMESGGYTVEREDLPAYQIYQCSLTGVDLCIRPLEAGEDNDRTGVHPDE